MNRYAVYAKAILIILLILILSPINAFAANETQPPAGFGGLLIALLIAFLTRKKAIGGWLFLYYFGAFSGLIVNIVVTSLKVRFLHLGRDNIIRWADD